MCRLNKGKAFDLATFLLDKNNILIKVLTDKRDNLLVDAITQYYQQIET